MQLNSMLGLSVMKPLKSLKPATVEEISCLNKDDMSSTPLRYSLPCPFQIPHPSPTRLTGPGEYQCTHTDVNI
jgi:hypothetical protein